MESLQTIEIDDEAYSTQRISIYHHGNSVSNPNRHVRIDGRMLYEEKRFSTAGEEQMLILANRSGFENIFSFFEFFEKTYGKNHFQGVIRFKDGFRYFDRENFG